MHRIVPFHYSITRTYQIARQFYYGVNLMTYSGDIKSTSPMLEAQPQPRILGLASLQIQARTSPAITAPPWHRHGILSRSRRNPSESSSTRGGDWDDRRHWRT